MFAGDRLKIDWQGNVRLFDGETLVLGAEHAEDSIRIRCRPTPRSTPGYAELQSAIAPNIFNAVNIRYDDNDRFGGRTTFREAPVYVVEATGTKLKASVGTGFKAPTLSEMFENFPSFGFFGNPNLKPETSFGWDAGFEQALANQTLQFGATYFHNNIRNLIDINAAGDSYANIGRARTDGVESFIAWQPLDALSLRADYTYTEAFDAQLHQELLRRPKHKVSLDARWQVTPELSLDADLLYVSSWIDVSRDGSIPRLTAPGYTTVDIAASYDVTDQITLYGRIDNLFDEDYQNPTGFLHPGRGVFGGKRRRSDDAPACAPCGRRSRDVRAGGGREAAAHHVAQSLHRRSSARSRCAVADRLDHLSVALAEQFLCLAGRQAAPGQSRARGRSTRGQA